MPLNAAFSASASNCSKSRAHAGDLIRVVGLHDNVKGVQAHTSPDPACLSGPSHSPGCFACRDIYAACRIGAVPWLRICGHEPASCWIVITGAEIVQIEVCLLLSVLELVGRGFGARDFVPAEATCVLPGTQDQDAPIRRCCTAVDATPAQFFDWRSALMSALVWNQNSQAESKG